MIHKTALLIASLAASLTLVVALAAADFAPGTAPAPVDAVSAVSANATTTPTAPLVQIDKVYVPAPVPQQTITVQTIVPTAGGENESGGND